MRKIHPKHDGNVHATNAIYFSKRASRRVRLRLELFSLSVASTRIDARSCDQLYDDKMCRANLMRIEFSSSEHSLNLASAERVFLYLSK